MIQLWTDLFIARAATNVKNTEQLRRINYMPFLYKKYKIDSARFMRSNIYYVSKTEDYEKMFEQVEQNILIAKYKNDFDLKGVDLNQPRKILDSIKNARSKVRTLEENNKQRIKLDTSKLKEFKGKADFTEDDPIPKGIE